MIKEIAQRIFGTAVVFLWIVVVSATFGIILGSAVNAYVVKAPQHRWTPSPVNRNKKVR
jgi:hypothetical protein